MDDCIFCKIAAGRLGSLVFEDDELAAFKDISPAGPVHVLIVPKEHIPGIKEVEGDAGIIGRMAARAVGIAREMGIFDTGFRLVVNSGPDGGQSVEHLHMHLLGGRPFGWPPG
ncbi:MAG TPA: histidine triad nucleotide-binding protein [Bacillota bacterium]|nr:histidine triad nucleotide-binding protein [Bacillota bacterium]HOH10669.1 histidine triad nucleotide-binding protein [Bacillota bacterium]HOY88708.1 histidine triad nucleotide-binding protein [Bacillota bacterium]HPI01327.1 histidine triad nucleotide-binding protein [Bacillota bacterium]HPM63726.1 histidine triad nucleotide-binding protein [Bacillota bacterium]